MRYIRTFSGIIVDTEQQAKRLDMSVEEYESKFPYSCSTKANTIEELCDRFVVAEHSLDDPFNVDFEIAKTFIGKAKVYGAIWTNKGLIYVAKMNEKGELELL